MHAKYVIYIFILYKTHLSVCKGGSYTLYREIEKKKKKKYLQKVGTATNQKYKTDFICNSLVIIGNLMKLRSPIH